MIIDSHAHLGKWHHLDGSPERLLREADRLGIERLCVSSAWAIAYEPDEGNRQVLDAVARWPDRIVGYYAIPSAHYAAQAVRELPNVVGDGGMRGLKIYTRYRVFEGGLAWTGVTLTEPSMWPLFELAAELRLPVLAHAAPQEFDAVARRVPAVRLIIAHLGDTAQGSGDYHRALAIARRHPNVYVDTCGSMVNLTLVEDAVAALGVEKVLFGTDLPILDPAAQLAKVTGARLDPAAKRRILGENIAALLERGP